MLDKLTPQMIEDIKAIAPVLVDLAELVKNPNAKKINVDISVNVGHGMIKYSLHEIEREEKAKQYQYFMRVKGRSLWTVISEAEYNEIMVLSETVLTPYEFKIEYAGFEE